MFREYVEAGYSVFPVGSNKRPAIKEWKPYQTRLPTEEELLLWEKQYANCGIALVCGEISKVLAVDIDTEDEEIRKSCPKSPVVKSGNPKKETRFFYFPHKMQKMNPPGVDILACGSYTVLPPSIHPETKKPYFWHNEHQLPSILAQDLPEITVEDVERIADTCYALTKDDRFNGVAGRNNYLSGVAYAIFLNNPDRSIKEAAEEILLRDEQNNSPTYFNDPNEDYYNKGKTPLERCIAFTRVQYNGLKKSGKIKEPAVIEVKEDAPVTGEPKQEDIEFELPGVLGSIYDCILSTSKWKQTNLALGGAIAVGSAICANRFRDRGSVATTKLYTMLVANSGSGKDAPRSVAEDIIAGMNSKDIEGYIGSMSNHSSEAALVEKLSSERVRLDVIDEFGEFFKSTNGKAASHKDGVANFLTRHYTNTGVYNGYYTKTAGKYMGACYNPSISLLAMIQPEIFLQNANPSNISSGFLGRFLYFFGRPQSMDIYLGNQGNKNTRLAIGYICNEIHESFPMLRYGKVMPDGRIWSDDSFSQPVCRHRGDDRSKDGDLTWADGVLRAKDELEYQMAQKEAELVRDGDVNGAALYSRRGMFIDRLVYVITACSGVRTIEMAHLDLSAKIVDYSLSQAATFVSGVGEDRIESRINLILKHLKGCPDGFSSKRAINKAVRFKSGEYKAAVSLMTDRGIVKEGNAKIRGKDVFGLKLDLDLGRD